MELITLIQILFIGWASLCIDFEALRLWIPPSTPETHTQPFKESDPVPPYSLCPTILLQCYTIAHHTTTFPYSLHPFTYSAVKLPIFFLIIVFVTIYYCCSCCKKTDWYKTRLLGYGFCWFTMFLNWGSVSWWSLWTHCFHCFWWGFPWLSLMHYCSQMFCSEFLSSVLGDIVLFYYLGNQIYKIKYGVFHPYSWSHEL